MPRGANPAFEGLTSLLDEAAADQARRFTHGRSRRQYLALAHEQHFLQEFERISKVIVGRYKAPSRRPRLNKSTKKHRILNVLLSDLHYGALLDGREVPMQYGPVEEARRTASILVQAADYKRQYRKDTTLYVHIIGDIIQGKLHDPQDAAPIAAQVQAAVHILAQGLMYLAGEFAKIKVYCTPGNHGRDKSRHHDRAVTQKWDAYETAVYTALRLMAQTNPRLNMEVVMPRTPYYDCRIFDKLAFFTHGDTVMKPGNPGKSIDIESVRNQANRFNKLSKLGRPYDMFATGHVHIGSVTQLPEGQIFMTNGCLIPTDAYALSIGAPGVNCGQWIWESVEGFVVGDQRFVTVDQATDRDGRLDDIIKPFSY
jgi:hypothetical protein